MTKSPRFNWETSPRLRALWSRLLVSGNVRPIMCAASAVANVVRPES
jgi:hypothetical protein